MATLKPSLRSTDTYTESNFLFLLSSAADASNRKVTLEHFCRSGNAGNDSGWLCQTIIDAELMSHEDAVFIAQSYASQNDIPVIYENHTD